MSWNTWKNLVTWGSKWKKGSKYKNAYISVTIDSTGLGVVPMDRYSFGTCHEILEKI